MPSVSTERVEICFVPSPVADHRYRRGFDLSHTLNLLPHVYSFKLGSGLFRRTGMRTVSVSGMENIYEVVPMSGQWAASREQRHLQNSWRCWRLQASAGSSSCVRVDLSNLSFDLNQCFCVRERQIILFAIFPRMDLLTLWTPCHLLEGIFIFSSAWGRSCSEWKFYHVCTQRSFSNNFKIHFSEFYT